MGIALYEFPKISGFGLGACAFLVILLVSLKAGVNLFEWMGFVEDYCLIVDGYDALGPDGIQGTADDHYFEPGSPAEECFLDPSLPRQVDP